MKYYPIHVKLDRKKVVVIGGGQVALRKVKELLEVGAKTHVIAKIPVKALKKMASKKKIILSSRPYRKGDLKDAVLAIAATEDREVNQAVTQEAEQRRIFMNVVDKTEYCSFITPAIVRRGDLVLTVSTSGVLPALARKIREDLEKIFGPEYGPYLKKLGQIRKNLIRRNVQDRSHLLNELVRQEMRQGIKA